MNTPQYITEILLKKAQNEFAYISDMDTYEVVYMTDKLKEQLGISSEQEFDGKKCYEVFKGLRQPCEDCSLNYVTEFYKPELKQWLRVESHSYCMDGSHHYRGEWISDVTEEHTRVEEMEMRLKNKSVVLQGLRTIASEKDPKKAIDALLQMIIEYYNADRVNVFEFEYESGVVDNTHEFCADGVPSEIEECQSIPIEYTNEWMEAFKKHKEIFIVSLETVQNEKLKELLQLLGVSQLLAVPIYKGEELGGFISVDDPKQYSEDATVLKMIAECITTEFAKRILTRNIEELSLVDRLTGLGNRNQYLQVLEDYIKTPPKTMAVFLSNLNGLKKVNEEGGHNLGDQFLCACANAMKTLNIANTFRIDGDEFVILAPNIPENEFHSMKTALRHALVNLPLGGAALGAVWEKGHINVPAMVSHADELMYAEKQIYYREAIQRGDQNYRTGVATNILRDIQDRKFEVFYQPQINLHTGNLYGAEALVRKRNEEGKIVPPDKFVPLYEAEGVISHMDLHVLELVCQALQRWKRELGKTPKISTNFSRVTLMEEGIIARICSICEKYEVDPATIMVEITESTGKLSHEQLEVLVKGLQQAGFSVSLDDFGSRYSNLSILSYIDFQLIKLDKSLIDRIGSDPKSTRLVKNLISSLCGDTLETRALAEGVETEEQARMLQEFDCDYVQGYYFAKPMPERDFTELLRVDKFFQTKAGMV